MRDEFVEFLVNTDTTHFITFATNSDMSETTARAKLNEWLKRVDKFALGKRYWKKTDERAFFVAVPESMGINTHYHALVRWPDSFSKKTEEIIQYSQGVWKDKLVKSGFLDVKCIDDKEGVAKYITKRFDTAVPSWLVSTEFHAV